MGLGIAMLGKSSNRPELVVIGMAGCLLHVWNHCFFKSLLFLGAGSVVHQTHTRQIDHLGGLAKTMPWTAALFLVGAIAICGLPPLNGFVSELFVYLGFFTIVTSDTNGLAAALGIPILAMIGALAGACFVKVYGAVFLGNPRSSSAMHTHESSISMRIPMVVLSVVCVLIGVAPMLVGSCISQVVAVWSPAVALSPPGLNTIVPLFKISVIAMVLVAGIAGAVLVAVFRKRVPSSVGTWDCGYARPSNQMQYTASSFAQSIVGLFRWVLHPHEHKPQLAGIFPKPAKMSSHVDEIVLDRLLVPGGRAFGRWANWFHRFQQGIIRHYILYILIALLLMLCTQMPIKEVFLHWFSH